MDVREKLVEVLKEIVAIQECGFGDPRPTYETVASYLMSPGVTVQEWIQVKDRLPTEEAKAYEKEWEDYPEYIVMIDRGYLPTTLYYDWENNEWFKINTALKREKYKVTYWMPLPQPPKGE